MKYKIVQIIILNILNCTILGIDNLKIINGSAAYDKYYYNLPYPTNPKFNGEFTTSRKLVKNGDIFFDVGAFVGEYSYEMARLFNNLKIYAFEPVSDHINAFLNKFHIKNNKTHHTDFRFGNNKIRIFNIAISDFIGKSKFYYYQSSGSISGLYNYEGYENKFKSKLIEVGVISLDKFCELNNIQKINYLKIDTEGGDYFVLLGAKNLLNNRKIDYIQFEYTDAYKGSKATLKKTCLFLTKLGYRIFKIIPEKIVHINEWRNSLENYLYSNYLAVSSTKCKNWPVMKF